MIKKFEKWWFVEYIKKYGWIGWLCDTFSINSNSHPYYVDGYKEGMEADWSRNPAVKSTQLQMEKMITMLDRSLANFNPARTRGICQLRGWKRAYMERYGGFMKSHE